jgi:superfamily I DNA/RNA helicase
MMEFEEGFLRVDLKQPGRDIRTIKRMLRAFKADWARLQHEDVGWPTDPADNLFHADMIAWLMFHRAMLIGELPALMRKYLELHPLAPARTTFEHVLVDEYQDLNKADQTVIDLLAQNGTLTVIGDEDQTIYTGLRHAQPESIRNFPLYHPNTYDVMMEICYRCPTTVVDMAAHLIRFNRDREARAFLPSPDNGPGDVAIVQWATMQEEIAGLAELIKLHKERTPHPRTANRTIDWDDIVVLTPREVHSTALTAALNAAGVPAHSYFRDKALDTVLAQERYTLLTLLARSDDRVGLRCWLGFHHTDNAVIPYRKFREYCEQHGRDPFYVMGDLAAGRIVVHGTERLVERWRAFESERNRIGAVTDQALIDALFPEGTVELAEVRGLAIDVLREQGEGVTAAKLLEELAPKIYSPEPPLNGDCVRVMSLHKAKGLTIHSVFLAGCNRGWLPFVEQDLQGEPATKKKEEQRRLFYVALTRCTHTLVLSSFLQIPLRDAPATHIFYTGRPTGPERLVRTEPSEFLAELGPNAPRAIPGATLLNEWRSACAA